MSMARATCVARVGLQLPAGLGELPQGRARLGRRRSCSRRATWITNELQGPANKQANVNKARSDAKAFKLSSQFAATRSTRLQDVADRRGTPPWGVPRLPLLGGADDQSARGHTNSYHTYSHDEALEGIAAAGFKHVELSASGAWRSTSTSRPTRASSAEADGLRLEPVSLSGHSDLTTPGTASSTAQGGALGRRVRDPDRQYRRRGPPVGAERGRLLGNINALADEAERAGCGRPRDPRDIMASGRGDDPASWRRSAGQRQDQLRHGERRLLLGRLGGRDIRRSRTRSSTCTSKETTGGRATGTSAPSAAASSTSRSAAAP